MRGAMRGAVRIEGQHGTRGFCASSWDRDEWSKEQCSDPGTRETRHELTRNAQCELSTTFAARKSAKRQRAIASAIASASSSKARLMFTACLQHGYKPPGNDVDDHERQAMTPSIWQFWGGSQGPLASRQLLRSCVPLPSDDRRRRR